MAALELGVRTFGERWGLILSRHSSRFLACRTAQDAAAKWRDMERKKQREDGEPGAAPPRPGQEPTAMLVAVPLAAAGESDAAEGVLDVAELGLMNKLPWCSCNEPDTYEQYTER